MTGAGARPAIGVTWWGHASTTVDVGGVRVCLDPLLTDRLFHLVRYGVTPEPAALAADVVLVSHLHADHCHLPSLARFGPDVTLVVPRGGERLLSRLGAGRLVPVGPGEVVRVGPDARLRVDVLAATHDGRRLPLGQDRGAALGFRLEVEGAGSVWFPGDTELRADMSAVPAVDVALVPIGGWGPTLGDGHMGPEDAATAVARVGATYAVPVHWGTFWPVGLQRVARDNHARLFQTPGARFLEAMRGTAGRPVLATPNERVEL